MYFARRANSEQKSEANLEGWHMFSWDKGRFFLTFMADFCPCTQPAMKPLDPEDFYYSPEGFIVFTEAYHRKRGHCCQSGCKHCPYGFDKRTGAFKKPTS
jgi:hypothetical protein